MKEEKTKKVSELHEKANPAQMTYHKVGESTGQAFSIGKKI